MRRKGLSRYAVSLAFFRLLFSGSLPAQVNEGGTPYSFLHTLRKPCPAVRMPAFDPDTVAAEEVQQAGESKPFRFGYGFNVSLGLGTAGVWETVPGGRLWRVKIKSPGAYSLNLIFSCFFMPQGARLFVYDPGGTAVLGAFTSRNNKPHGKFATAPTPGDTCCIEYFEPEEVRGQGRVVIGRVVHAYCNLFGFRKTKEFMDSGMCNVNVYCPEAVPWRDEVRAVGMVLCGGGQRCCTGVLLNNVREDRTPYFLTANRCIQGQSLDTWVVLFNYQSPDCSNTEGPKTYAVSGSTLRAFSDRADFALLELNEAPPPEYNVYYAGWTRNDNPPDFTASVHHPRGDIKKIAIDLQAPEATAVGQTLAWKIFDWDMGATEPGSDGAPLFDPNGHVIGQLFSRNSSCPREGLGPDYFGRFAIAWDAEPDPRKRLRDWLDPDSTGVMELEGLVPFTPPAVSITSPADGAAVFGTVDIAVEASDPDGIREVQFYVGGVLSGTDTEEPYSFTWDTSAQEAGTCVIRVVAVSTTGLWAEATISVTVSRDCNQNGFADSEDIQAGRSQDCNGNAIPDECDITSGESSDCNQNGIPDSCELRAGDYGLVQAEPLPLNGRPRVVVAADFDSDGDQDLIAATTQPNQLVVLLHSQDGTFSARSTDLSRAPLGLAAGDLDGDDDLDLVLTLEGTRDNLLTVLGTGQGEIDKIFKETTGVNPVAVALADLEPDGDLDIVLACEGSGDIRVLRNFGNAAFAQHIIPTEGEPLSVCAGDFNEDGAVDVAYTEFGVNSVLLLVNRGDGSFAPVVLVPAGELGALLQSSTAADGNGDGHLDLFFADGEHDAVIWLPGKGDGTFEAFKALTVESKPEALTVIDLNDDSFLDVVCTGNEKLSVLLNNGNGAFQAQEPLSAEPEPRAVAAFDFTGSSLPDLAVATEGAAQIALFVNQGAPALSRDCNGNGVPDSCDIEAGGADDCNANGIPDQCDLERGVLTDANANGIPDECETGETLFKRADPNVDGRVNIADAVSILGYVFGGKPPPSCLKGADTNDDGKVNIADAVYALGYVFGGRPPPPEPFAQCGTDPTEDQLSCESFPPCR